MNNIKSVAVTSDLKTIVYYSNFQLLKCSAPDYRVSLKIATSFGFHQLLFSHCEKYLYGAVCWSKKAIMKFSASNLAKLDETCEHMHYITNILIYPDRPILVSSSFDGVMKFWSLTTSLKYSVLSAKLSSSGITSIVSNPEEKSLIFSSSKGTLSISSIENLKLKCKVKLNETIFILQIDQARRSVLVGSDNYVIECRSDNLAILQKFGIFQDVSAFWLKKLRGFSVFVGAMSGLEIKAMSNLPLKKLKFVDQGFNVLKIESQSNKEILLLTEGDLAFGQFELKNECFLVKIGRFRRRASRMLWRRRKDGGEATVSFRSKFLIQSK